MFDPPCDRHAMDRCPDCTPSPVRVPTGDPHSEPLTERIVSFVDDVWAGRIGKNEAKEALRSLVRDVVGPVEKERDAWRRGGELAAKVSLEVIGERFKAEFWKIAAERELTCCNGEHMVGGGPEKYEVDAAIDATIRTLMEPKP